MTRLMAERIVAVALILAGGFMYTQSTGWPQRSGAFPQFAQIGIMVLGLRDAAQLHREGPNARRA